ncbi:GntR family transcriptional regulator [Bifidobacterium minimum]|uniref:GntR family transcriptional regulator n=1 Tax=Bifidobacterium minimum TaxID=1693 RepID=A0A087BL87_9BIFI|nr:GntR family transcriptional regulator [Bifidobacterium minimum]KFI71787.1 GntR family transcriptional regulator [Bifidobacterium minimum]
MDFTEQSGVALYLQVADQLEELIISGSAPEGDRVPSTTEISTTYRINPATVLKGMGLLVSQGYLEKRRGVGMFVTPGARERLVESRRKDFLARAVPDLVAQAHDLGITTDGLIQAIEGASS